MKRKIPRCTSITTLRKLGGQLPTEIGELRYAEFASGAALAAKLRQIGVDPGTRLATDAEHTFQVLILDASLYARANYTATVVVLAGEDLFATYHVA